MLLSIEKLIYGGDGLARTAADADGRSLGGQSLDGRSLDGRSLDGRSLDGRSLPVFVPFVLPGERVEADIRREKAGFARGSVKHLIEASADRVEARCPYFRQCGGCHYQHIRYERQLDFKAAILRETLLRIGKIDLTAEINVHGSPPWNYRNRTRLRVRTSPEFALGYFRFGSHEFLPVKECPISSPLINRAMARLLELRGLDCPTAVEEIELLADAEDERLLAWAMCEHGPQRDLLRWAEALRSALPEIVGVSFFASRQKQRAEDDAAGDVKLLAECGAKSIRYRTRSCEYRVSAGAFFQVNRYLIDELVSVVAGGAAGEVGLDLYAGVGLFSAELARNFHHIFGVEASLTSQADFVQNVPANVKAVAGRTEQYLKGDYQKGGHATRRPGRRQPDMVVLDPPRAGAGKEVIRSLVELGAPRVRYVSCDPATLARDIAPLLAAGYRIEEAHLFDLFPQTFHIETVMLLSR